MKSDCRSPGGRLKMQHQTVGPDSASASCFTNQNRDRPRYGGERPHERLGLNEMPKSGDQMEPCGNMYGNRNTEENNRSRKRVCYDNQWVESRQESQAAPQRHKLSKLRAASSSLPNLLFIFLTSAVLHLTIPASQASSSPETTFPSADPHVWFTNRRPVGGHQPTSSSFASKQRFAHPRGVSLASSQVYKTTTNSADGEVEAPSVEQDKILHLHSQLSSLRRQLEIELKRSQGHNNNNNKTDDSMSHVTSEQHGEQAPMRSQRVTLGSPCLAASDCSETIRFSHCQLSSFTCACLPEHVQFNSTTCLPPVLLGYECQLDAQCRQRVPDSECQLGKCACGGDKFVPYRKSKCLPASLINDYCLTDGQCQLNDRHSFCKWKIPNVYGTCKCPPNYKLLANGTTAGAASRAGLRCGPRLGDTCLSHDECLQVTPNSHCSGSAPTVGRSWPSSSASSSRCTCAPGFEWAPNRLTCRPVEERTSAAQSHLDSHKYETVIPETTPRTTSSGPPIDRAQAEQQQQEKRPTAASELEIKFVPLPSEPTSTTSTTTTGKPTEVTRGSPASEQTRKPIPEQQGNGTQPGSFRMSSLGKPCRSRQECQARDPFSDCLGGICECQMPSERCGAHAPGCRPGTFQCRNGQCISWYFVCDSFRNCDDGSDEEACQAGPGAACPPGAFECHSDGRCLSLGKLCNGKRDCADGSDEFGCQQVAADSNLNSTGGGALGRHSCPPNTFACYDGRQCLPAYVFCNAVEDCADGSDEDEQVCERSGVPKAASASAATTASATTTTTSRHRPAADERTPPTSTGRPAAPVGSSGLATPTRDRNATPISQNQPTDSESPLVKTDRASIERLMAALALAQRTPENRAQRRRNSKRSLLAANQHSAPAARAGGECPRWAFTCRNGKCRSSAILCSGVDGCGDNSDEDQCEVCQCEPPRPTANTKAPALRGAGERRRNHRATSTTSTTTWPGPTSAGLLY